MKSLLSICFALMTFASVSQITINPADISYVSKWKYPDLIPSLDAGTWILFKQNCIPDRPAEFPTGTILFERVEIDDDIIAMSIEFKDTVVTKVTYYLEYKQKSLLPKLGLGNIQPHATNKDGEWTSSNIENSSLITIFADRKKVIIIKQYIF